MQSGWCGGSKAVIAFYAARHLPLFLTVLLNFSGQ